MAYNLTAAAAAGGVNKATVLRAIKTGRVSAQQDDTGQWSIDPAEFHRVFPALALARTTGQQDATADALVTELRALIADLRQDRDHWHGEATQWREQAQHLLPKMQQPAPAERPLFFWWPLFLWWRQPLAG